MHTLMHLYSAHPWLVGGPVVGAGALILAAILRSMESMIEALGDFALGLVFVQKELDDLYSMRIVTDYLDEKGHGYGISTERYEATYKHVRTVEGFRNVFYRMNWGSWRIWLFRGRPLVLIPSGGSSDDKPKIVFFRGTVNWIQLVIDAAKSRDDRLTTFKDTNRRFKIRRHVGSHKTMTMVKAGDVTAPNDEKQSKHQLIAADTGEPIFWNRDEIGPPMPDSPLELLAINASMQRVIDDVKFWHSRQAWYHKKGIMWKLGILLFGDPGVGKTSIIRALVEELDIPLHTFNLASMDDHDFEMAWQESQRDKPRAVLFEDFDTVFHGRKNVIEGSELSFQAILNAVDGIEREDGLLFFITTNHVEFIDDALGKPSATIETAEGDPMSTRPGRVDLTIKLEGIDHAGRIKLAKRILDEEELAITMAERYSTDSAAQFQERCRQMAKKQLWTQAP